MKTKDEYVAQNARLQMSLNNLEIKYRQLTEQVKHPIVRVALWLTGKK